MPINDVARQVERLRLPLLRERLELFGSTRSAGALRRTPIRAGTLRAYASYAPQYSALDRLTLHVQFPRPRYRDTLNQIRRPIWGSFQLLRMARVRRTSSGTRHRTCSRRQIIPLVRGPRPRAARPIHASDRFNTASTIAIDFFAREGVYSACCCVF